MSSVWSGRRRVCVAVNIESRKGFALSSFARSNSLSLFSLGRLSHTVSVPPEYDGRL